MLQLPEPRQLKEGRLGKSVDLQMTVFQDHLGVSGCLGGASSPAALRQGLQPGTDLINPKSFPSKSKTMSKMLLNEPEQECLDFVVKYTPTALRTGLAGLHQPKVRSLSLVGLVPFPRFTPPHHQELLNYPPIRELPRENTTSELLAESRPIARSAR